MSKLYEHFYDTGHRFWCEKQKLLVAKQTRGQEKFTKQQKL
jgi:hypothetical protein